MVIFLFGEDAFRSRRKLNELKEKYLREVDSSGLNLNVLEDKTSASDLRAAVSAAPFLAPKRFVIASGLISAAKKAESEALSEIVDAVPEDTILVLHEPASGEDLDGSPAFEKLKDGKFYPEFKPLKPREVEYWIKEESAARSLAFTPDGLRAFTTDVGNDLWKLSADLDKLASYAKAHGKPVDAEAVMALTERQAEADLFSFLDAIGTRQAARAAELLERLLEQGESEVAVLNRIQSHVRNLLLVREMAAEGPLEKARVAKELGIHPFVATKAIAQADRYSSEELRKLYATLIDADERLKTGGWASPRLAIEVILLELNKSSS